MENQNERVIFLQSNFITFLLETQIDDIDDDKKILLLKKSIAFIHNEIKQIKEDTNVD